MSETSETELSDAALLQYAFKSDTVRRVAVAVAQAFDQAPGQFVWQDEIVLPELDAADKNIIGLVFKNMGKWGMIRRLGGEQDHRRSQRKDRRGGVAWRYQLVNLELLRTFMRRNQCAPQELQPNLL